MKKATLLFLVVNTLVVFIVNAQKTWTGASSTAWNLAGNWNPVGIPTASDNVIIPSGTTNSPTVSGATGGVCNNLTVNSGATLSITGTSGSSTTLTVGGTATFNGVLSIGGHYLGNTGKLVATNVVWSSTSGITSYFNARCEVSGNWTFASGSSVNLGFCLLTFTGGSSSNIYNYSASSSFGSVTLSKTGNSVVYINSASNATVTINGILTIGAASVLIGDPNITTILTDNLVNSGNMYLNSGTLSLEKASGTQDIQINTNDYINSLRINTGGTVTLSTSYYLQLKGSMTIQAGVLNPQNNTIALWGDWTNNVGTSGFEEGTGRVNFNGGNYHQYCSNETFSTLEIQKTVGGALRMNGTTVTCSIYDWTAGAIDVINNGTFTVTWQLADNGIAGNFYVNTGCTINLTNLTGNVDLKGNLYIYGGNFNVNGGINPSWWPSGGNASITMSGGTLNFVDQSIVVKTDATYSFTNNITGGTIRTAKNFSNGRADFTPSAGTIELYGSTESYLLMTTGNLYALKINKTVGTTVNLDANATINGGIDVFSGTLRVNNKVLTTIESVVINNGGTLWMDLNSQLKIGGSKTLNVNSGGTLRVIGTSGNEAVITRNGSSGYYVINISSGGTVAAKYASFYYVDPLRVYSGATIEAANPFSYCKFRYAQFGMLRIDNSQNLLIRNVEFLTPATGYNVYKSVNSGSLEFKDASGDYSGATYENDPYNRINWTVTQPGLWTGAVSTSWSNTENWDDFTVPVAGTNVTIPASAPYMPVLDAGIWQCNNLTVDGTITFAGANLTANGNLNMNGTLAMNNASSQFTVVGDVAWNSGSTANITANGIILVNGHWNFNAGSNAQMNNGRVYFQGTVSKWIRCYSANSNFYSVYVTKTGGAQAGFSDLSTQPMVIKGELRIFANGKFVSDSFEDVILHGNLTNDGTLQCNAGAFKLDGATQSLKPNTSDYFNHLVFSQTGTASINTANTSTIRINGNLHIDSGVFDAGNCIIQVGGNWDNNVGTSAFTEGGSRVIFNGGNYHQYINNSEDFAILEINKASGGALRITNNSVVTAGAYDWTAGALDMTSGSFTAPSLLDNGIAGNFYINSGTTVTLGSYGSSPHLKGNLYMYGGTLNIIAAIESQWPGDGNSSITMSGGEINVYPYGIQIVNNAPYTFTTNITGGTIKTEGVFINNRSDFNPAGGTVELYGSENTSITMNAGSLQGLTINKPSDKTVTLATNATVNDLLTVQSGTLKVNNKVLTTGHNIAVNNGGILWMDLNSQLKIANGKFLDVNTGGLLKAIGSAGNEVVFNINGTGYYYIYINGTGTISTRWTSFYYVNPINVGTSAIIDPANPFDYCKFRYSATGMLNVLNGQDLTIYNVEFLTPAVGYNVSKPNNQGSLTFKDASGDFSGPAYENDPNNRIHWIYTQPGLWTGAVSSNWYTGDNWDDGLVPVAATNVTIPATAPFMPVIDAGIWECNNLTVEGSITFSGANLTVNGDLEIHGNLTMNAPADQLIVMGDVNWEAGSQGAVTADAVIRVYGNWKFDEASNVQLNNGTVHFQGNQNKKIYNLLSNSYFNSIYVNKTGGAEIRFGEGIAWDLYVNGDFRVFPGAKFVFDPGYDFYFFEVLGNIISDGIFQCESGGVWLKGVNQTIKLNANDYFNDLTFYQSGTVSINTANTSTIRVNGNIHFDSGVFNAGNCIIQVGGNWDNNVGTSAFTEGGSRVIFNGGNYHQYINNSEDFAILEINKASGGALRITNNSVVTAGAYDWTAGALDMTSGSFTAPSLLDNGIAGNFYINSGTTVTLGSYGSSPHLKGNLYMYGGTLNIIAAIESQWPGDGNSSITMSGGEINVYPYGIQIVNNAPYTFTTNITGGTIKTEGVFINNRSDFNPAGGTVELYGSENTSITMNAGSLQGLTINKPSDKTVTLATNATVNDLLTVQSGTLKVNNKVLTTGHNIAVNNGGILWMDLNSQLKIANGKFLDVNTGGLLKAIGSAGNEVVFNINGTGYYYIYINGTGTISTRWTSFYYVNPINVGTSAIIDPANPFDYCKFRYSATGMLNVLNGQDLTIYNVEFLTPAVGYNVSKPNNQGSLTFKDASGDFSGPAYENDPNNRIHWIYTQPGLWTGAVSSNWYTGDNWDDGLVPVAATNVTIPATAPFMPVIDAGIWECNNLTISGTLTIAGGNLTANGNMTVNGTLAMNSAADQLTILGDVAWESGSQANITADAAILVNGHWNFNAGSNAQMNNGRVYFQGNQNKTIYSNSTDSRFHSVYVMKTGGTAIILDNISTEVLYILGDLRIFPGAKFITTQGNIHINLYGSLESDGIFQCNGGSFSFNGINGNRTMKLNVDDYFYDFYLYISDTLTINKDNTSVIKIKGSVALFHGTLDATGCTIHVKYHWHSGYNPDGGIIGGRLIFDSNYEQILSGGYYPATFNIIEVNKTNGSLLKIQGNVTCQSYDWTAGGIKVAATNSKFTALGLEDNAITGNFYLDAGEINIYPGTDKYDLSGNFFINGGNFNVYGDVLEWPTSRWGYYSDCSLTMTGGLMNFIDLSINAGNTPFGGDFTFTGDITGGIIRTNGSFLTSSSFQPLGGDVELVGQDNSIIYGVFGGSYYNLIVDKTSSSSEVLGVSVIVTNNLTIKKGVFDISDFVMCWNKIDIMDGGTLSGTGAMSINLNNNSSINVFSNGVLSLEHFGSSVTGYLSSFYYSINAYNGSTVRVKNTEFRQLTDQGFYVAPGAFVDPDYSFDGCRFEDGKNGLNAYLTIDNDQDLIINNVLFSENTTGILHNARKNVNSGSVTFVGATGGFSGPLYENDPYNRIHWTTGLNYVHAHVFLEGPFTGTNMNALIQVTDGFPLSQPYNTAPWNYNGAETVTSVPVDVVDWVLIEFRDAPSAELATAATTFKRMAAFVKKNGSIVGLDGVSMLEFDHVIDHQLFLVVMHRNHLGVMSSAPLVKSGDTYTYDFTTGTGQAYGGTMGYKLHTSGNAVMVAGDANADGAVSPVDKTIHWAQQAGNKGYLQTDFSMDKQVDNTDKNLYWLPNFLGGYSSQVP